jgi:hypothetical protein
VLEKGPVMRAVEHPNHLQHRCCSSSSPHRSVTDMTAARLALPCSAAALVKAGSANSERIRAILIRLLRLQVLDGDGRLLRWRFEPAFDALLHAGH